MTFQNYKASDYAQSTFLGSISSSATALQVQAWDWALFPSEWDFFLTLEAFTVDEIGIETITKSEQVKVTSISWDTMTIVRGQNWTTAQAFDANDDRVSLYFVAENLNDINTEVERLEWDKLDSVGALRTWLWESKILITNASGEEAELALSGNANQTLLGDWSRGASQVDLNWLANDNWLSTSDKLMYYDHSDWINKKREAQASDTIPWLVERATDTEATTWTDTTRYVTPKQVKDNYSFNKYSSGSVEVYGDNPEDSHWSSTGSRQKVKSVNVVFPWTYKVDYEARGATTDAFDHRSNIYVNWVAVWIERTALWNTYSLYSEDITLNPGDEIAIYLWSDDSRITYVQNFKLRWTKAIVSSDFYNL